MNTPQHPKKIPAFKVVALGEMTQFGWVKRPSVCGDCHQDLGGIECMEAHLHDLAAAILQPAPPVAAPAPVATPSPITPAQVDYLMAWWDHLTPPAKKVDGARTAANGRALAMSRVEASERLTALEAQHGRLPHRTTA